MGLGIGGGLGTIPHGYQGMDVPGGLCLLRRFSFLDGSWQTSLCVFAGGRDHELIGVSSCKNTNAIGQDRNPPLWSCLTLITFMKAISLNPITLGIGVSPNAFWRMVGHWSHCSLCECSLGGACYIDYNVCGILQNNTLVILHHNWSCLHPSLELQLHEIECMPILYITVFSIQTTVLWKYRYLMNIY